MKKRSGDLAGAIADHTKTIELRPKDAIAYFSRGKATEAKGDMTGANADYIKAGQLNPNARAIYDAALRARVTLGPAPRVVVKYLAAAGRKDVSAARVFLLKESGIDITPEFQVNEASGWKFSVEDIKIVTETTEEGKASVVVVVAFKRG